MTAATTPLLIAVFWDRNHAGQLLAELRDGRGAGSGGIIDAAALTRDEAGLCRITNSWDRDAHGLFVGGVVGTFIACLAGPAMATRAGGTVLGGLRGRLQSAPLKFELLAIGHELPPGASLLVAMVAPGWVDHLGQELRAGAALLLTYELRGSVVEQLDDGGDVAFLFPPGGTQYAANSALPDREGAGHHLDPLPSEGGIVVNAAMPSGDRTAMATSGEAG